MEKTGPNGDAWREFARRLKHAREAASMTQAQLARRAGVDRGLLSRLEQECRPMVSAETLLRLSAGLSVRPEWLWRGEGRMRPPLDPPEGLHKEIATAISKNDAMYPPSVIAVAKTLADEGERHTATGWIARLNEIHERLAPLLPR